MAQFDITRLGHQGDGIAEGPVFVPLTLPGEVVEGDVIDGRIAQPKIIAASDQRQKPPCPHYRACGGCLVQHARDAFVADWKIGIVRAALEGQGLTADISGISTSAPNTRRRATLHGRRSKSGALVGFHARSSDLLTEVPNCLVLDPALLAMIPVLRNITALAASRKGEIDFGLTLCDTGIDLNVSGARDLTAPEAQEVLRLGGEALCRLTWNGEVLASLRPALLQIGGVSVAFPPGAFLQATREGEATLTETVLRHCSSASTVADLFAGIGTFALPLAAHATVHAVEGDKAMSGALAHAARHATGLNALTCEARDLFRQPLELDELKRFDAIVIDPPRAGAEAQSHVLARSNVPVISAVSCNPATFARDARILTEGGYHLHDVLVVDQFRWSAHVELVALLTKP